jgi:hypothetical protein
MLILTQRDGKPWTKAGFSSSGRRNVIRAGIEGRTFHDIRGTAVTRLSLAECTEAEINVRSILDANYLHPDPKLAESAIKKLERRTKNPD